GAAILLAVFAAGATAQPIDKRSTLTFSGPVTIPGVTLPAGSYLFRLADSSHRDVIQVLSADGRTPYAQFFALQASRAERVIDPDVTFLETGACQARAIKTWWYIDQSGFDFQYPREQAKLMAEGVCPAVAALPPEPVIIASEEVVVEPVAPVKEAEVARAEPAPAFEAAPAAEEPAREALPKTDSPMATTSMLGLVALMTGILVRRYRAAR
ncbi:MAG TPA: hypothetical protein VFE12_08670, partial [Acetobacteraceae bacterium]|nr:hypothetical protein [Acetobacteraceae bacterium]